MPHPRFHRLSRDKQRRLLEAAAGEFAAHGYEAASLNRLIETAGISKGAFYYYFDDKADLFTTVTEMAWEAFLPQDPVALDELDAGCFWDRLRQAFLETMANARRHPWLPGMAKLLYHPPRGAGVDDVVSAQFEQARDWLGSLLRRGQELGVVRADLPGDLMRAMVGGAVDGGDRWVVEHWEELEPAGLDEMLPRIFHLLRRMVEPPGREGA